jgi:hypothetical protein
MISGISKTLLLLTALLPNAVWCATSAELITRLAKPAPATVEFSELRYSPMLKQPLRVQGTLRYLGPQQLEREVMAPHRELTRIDAHAVRIEREGAKPRTVALQRVPELRVLLNSFTALLTGDAAALERDFTIASAEANGGWRITLQPRDGRLQRRVPELRIEGREAQLRCFTLLDARGGANLMLIGEAIQAAPQTTERAQLEEYCRGT